MEITRLNAGLCDFVASLLKLESAEVGFSHNSPPDSHWLLHPGCLMEKLRAPGGLTCTNRQPEPFLCLQALPQEEPATGPLHVFAHQTPRSTSPL